MKFSQKDIAQYYDVTREHYQYFWKLNKVRSLHYGYWDENTTSFAAALTNINREMAKHANIQNGFKILDTGCGEGGSMAWLAKRFSVDIKGITLSQKQCNAGNAYFECQNISNAKIEVQDYTNTTFEDATFDVVWAIESVCHAENKASYLKEMYRVLKPGGTLIIADFFIERKLNPNEQKTIQNWAHSWAVPSFEHIATFKEKATMIGFESITSENCTKNVAKSVARLFRMFFIGLPFALIYNLIHPNTTGISKRNVYSPYWQYLAFKQRSWEYYIVKMRK